MESEDPVYNDLIEAGANLDDPIQRSVVRNLMKTGMLISSLNKAGVSFRQHIAWMETRSDYRDAIATAEQLIPQILKDHIINAAIHGIKTPIIQDGEITKWYRKKEWKFMLKAQEMIEGGGRGKTKIGVNHGQVTQVTINQNVDAKRLVLETLLKEKELRERSAQEVEVGSEDPQGSLPRVPLLPPPNVGTDGGGVVDADVSQREHLADG